MDIIESLTARIEDYRKTNKTPCKNYATRENAAKAAKETAHHIAKHFALSDDFKPCRYVIFKVEAWGRWVVCYDLTELTRRPDMTGGYMGIAGDNFTY